MYYIEYQYPDSQPERFTDEHDRIIRFENIDAATMVARYALAREDTSCVDVKIIECETGLVIDLGTI